MTGVRVLKTFGLIKYGNKETKKMTRIFKYLEANPNLVYKN